MILATYFALSDSSELSLRRVPRFRGESVRGLLVTLDDRNRPVLSI